MRKRSRGGELAALTLIAVAGACSTSEARVMFTRTTARYVRFVALSEINGNPWASVAELRMVGGAP